jgi:tetratricopeptide (TPR) repeat protein
MPLLHSKEERAMSNKCLFNLAVVAAIAVAFGVRVVAAGDARQSTKTSQTRDEIRLIDSTDSPAAEPATTRESAPAPAADKPATRVPTRAKRRPDKGLRPAEGDAAPLQPTPSTHKSESDSALPEPPSQPHPDAESAKPAEEPLRPIADPQEGLPVPVEVASLKGVAPGQATKEDVETAWGRPKATSNVDGAMVQLYSINPFKRIEVTFAGNKVASIVIRLDRALPADALAKQLDLAVVRPVLVSNDVGEVLGQSYPERGVVFSFEPGGESGKISMTVRQVLLEPITAEPFLLRAETTLDVRHDLARHDLEQALKLEPDNARAHWLLGRVLGVLGQHDQAELAAAEAVRLEPDNPQYHVTHAQTLAQVGRLPQALEEAQKGIAAGDKRPHVKARATCLVADLTASGPKPDFTKALNLHTRAVQLADPLSKDVHPAIRVAAKEVLVDSYLGAAHDIAWGDWKEKPRALAKWIEHATNVADDLVQNDGGNREVLFRVYSRSLSAYVGVRGEIDPSAAVKGATETGDALIAAARDPVQKARLQWEVGTALYDAVQICQMRAEHDHALQHGETAVGYLSKANEAHPTPASTFLLGRLYFRLGAIHAMRDHDHKKAVTWFEKSIPLLDNTSPQEVLADLGRHGEGYIIMGVSYWETGERSRAVQLTEKGIRWMERAAKQGTLDRSALAVPYGNLAAMHRSLGAKEEATRYQEMASRVKGETLK